MARPSRRDRWGGSRIWPCSLGMIRHPEPPRGNKAVLLVFAADHGLTEEGVSRYPSAVTVAMVMTYSPAAPAPMPLPPPAM